MFSNVRHPSRIAAKLRRPEAPPGSGARSRGPPAGGYFPRQTDLRTLSWLRVVPPLPHEPASPPSDTGQ